MLQRLSSVGSALSSQYPLAVSFVVRATAAPNVQSDHAIPVSASVAGEVPAFRGNITKNAPEQSLGKRSIASLLSTTGHPMNLQLSNLRSGVQWEEEQL